MGLNKTKMVSPLVTPFEFPLFGFCQSKQVVDPWSVTTYWAAVESMFCLLFSRSADLGPSGPHSPFILKVEQRQAQSEGDRQRVQRCLWSTGSTQRELATDSIRFKQGGQRRADCLLPWVELCWRIRLAARCWEVLRQRFPASGKKMDSLAQIKVSRLSGVCISPTSVSRNISPTS